MGDIPGSATRQAGEGWLPVKLFSQLRYYHIRSPGSTARGRPRAASLALRFPGRHSGRNAAVAGTVVAVLVAVVPAARLFAEPKASDAPGVALARVDSLVAAGQAAAAVPLALQARERWKDDPVFGWQVEARAGEACLAAGRGPESLPFLEQACRLRPTEGVLHHRLGTALAQMGRTGRALAEFEEAARLSPTDPAPFLEAGRLRAGLGDLGRARVAFEAARVACGGCPEADRLLGSVLLAAGKPAEAIAPLSRLWSVHPDSLVRRHLLAAFVGAQQDSAVLALVASTPAHQLDRDDWRMAVQAEGRVGGADWSSAAVAAPADRASRFPSDDAVFWAQAARNLERSGRLDAALTAVDRAVALEPGRAVFLHNRAAILAALGRTGEAREALEASKRLEAADLAPKRR